MSVLKKNVLRKSAKLSGRYFVIFSFLLYALFPYQGAIVLADDEIVQEATVVSEEQPVESSEDPEPVIEDEPAPEAAAEEEIIESSEAEVPAEGEEAIESGETETPSETNESSETAEEEITEEEIIQEVVEDAIDESISIENMESSSTSNSPETDQQILNLPEVPEGDPSATNTTTGADSTNTTETTVNNETNVTNENNAVTVNNSSLLSNTGNNDASFNTGSGIITTQKAEGRGELINLINNNTVNVESAASGPIDASNANTGSNSTNEALVDITNQTVIRNINASDTQNMVAADVISGRNSTNSNTGHGIILTGEAALGLNVVTVSNTNFTNVGNLQADMQNVFGNYTGNLDFSAASSSNNEISEALINAGNSTTGSGSSNSAIVNINDETEITNINSGSIQNNIAANVISGQNKANYNTGTGSIASGDVNSSVSLLNFLNANVTASNFWLKSLNVFGDWSGNINLPSMPAPNLTVSSYSAAGTNSQTGAGSTNEATVDMNNEVAIDNSNEADISNNFNVRSNTGNNLTSFNNGSGIVQYGEADAQVNTANVSDLNITGDSWWLLIVNKFGNWLGTTVGSPENMVVDSNANSTVLSPENSGVTVRNDETGANSNNSAGATINHSTDISNSNTATIQNEVSVIAVSGENEAQYNVGHGYIDAGDIQSAINSVNFANINMNVGNMLIGIVNVFGEWSGNIQFNNSATGSASSQSGTPSESVSANNTTGSGSTNDAGSTTNTTTNINNTNDSTTNNTTAANTTTGDNQANYNTGSGIVSTGGATTTSNATNQSNNNDVNVGAIDCGDTIAANNTTGADSENTTEVSNDCETNINNDNTSSTNNNNTINNSTGGNASSYNTGDGVVDTAWAETFVQLYNQNNENDITVGDVTDAIEDAIEEEEEQQEESPAPENNTGNTSEGAQNNTTGNGSPSAGSTSSPQAGSGSSSGGGGGGGGGGSASAAFGPVTQNGTTGLRGDINKDGKVDIYDISILLANWGAKFKLKEADVNGDNKTTMADFSIVMADWTRSMKNLASN